MRSNESQAELKQLKVNAIINSQERVLSDEVASLTNDQGIQAALDAVGGSMGVAVLKSVGMNATIVLYVMLNQELVCKHNADVVLKLLTIKGIGLDHWLAGQTKQQKQEMVEVLIELLAKPDFQMPIAGSFQLHEIEKPYSTVYRIKVKEKHFS